MAIRYMTMRDSNEEKRRFKEGLPNYIIGIIIFVGATNLAYYLAELVTYILSDLVT